MARTSAADEDPASTDVEQPIRDHLRACKASALHLELRDYYTPDDPWLRSWLDGDRDAFDQQLDRSWLDLIQGVTSRGVSIKRLRVVSEPVSDYIRFEHATTDSNVEAGEQVRWLARRRAADLLLPGNDCWVFDERLVLFNWFDGPGEWIGTELCGDRDVARRHAAAFGAAWDRGIPHADYQLT
jgi:hypothetical protein